MSELKVYIDFKSPYAFIAIDATHALEQEFGIEVDWYPLTLNIGSYLGTAKKDDTGKVTESKRSPRQWLAVKYAYKDARRYAELRGLTLKGTQKIWDSSLGAIGLLWAKGHGHDALKRYIDDTYERFWKRELDIEDVDVVIAQLQRAGCPLEGFAEFLRGEGRENHDKLQDEILDLGYYGVPTYVINGQSYFGRQHLPRVRWHLGGEVGSLPDIAYDTVSSRLQNRDLSTSDDTMTNETITNETITVYVSFDDLPSWLAINPLRQLVDDTGVQVEIKPLLSSLGALVNTNLKPGEDDPLAAYKSRRGKARKMASGRERQRMSDLLNISFKAAQRRIDPLPWSVGLVWLNELNTEFDVLLRYVESVFAHVYDLEAPRSGYQPVIDLFKTLGLENSGFEAFASNNEASVLASGEQILESGIFSAPAFVVAGEVFHGREHLALISWMFSAREGAPPV